MESLTVNNSPEKAARRYLLKKAAQEGIQKGYLKRISGNSEYVNQIAFNTLLASLRVRVNEQVYRFDLSAKQVVVVPTPNVSIIIDQPTTPPSPLRTIPFDITGRRVPTWDVWRDHLYCFNGWEGGRALGKVVMWISSIGTLGLLALGIWLASKCVDLYEKKHITVVETASGV